MRRALLGLVLGCCGTLLGAQLGGLVGDETWAVQVAAAYCPPYVYLALWTLAGSARSLGPPAGVGGPGSARGEGL